MASNSEKWFHVIGIGYVKTTSKELRQALPQNWQIKETEFSGIAFK